MVPALLISFYLGITGELNAGNEYRHPLSIMYYYLWDYGKIALFLLLGFQLFRNREIANTISCVKFGLIIRVIEMVAITYIAVYPLFNLYAWYIAYKQVQIGLFSEEEFYDFAKHKEVVHMFWAIAASAVALLPWIYRTANEEYEKVYGRQTKGKRFLIFIMGLLTIYAGYKAGNAILNSIFGKKNCKTR